MRKWAALPLLWFAAVFAHGQQTSTPLPPKEIPTTEPATGAPLPPVRELLLDVDRNMRAAEATRKDYTYHVHLEEEDLDGKGVVKKTTVTDSESVTVDGVRIDRVVARNGKPLTPEEQKKESDRIDKEVAKDKDRRAKREDKGQETDSRGDTILPASRILELGSFTNPRRLLLEGRPTIVFDYAGDPNAKKRNDFEGIVKDLVGTVWIDEQDRILSQAEGRFLNDFKIAGGLVLNIHKGLSFQFHATKVNGEVWLPASVDGQGSARLLLVDGVNGRFRLVTSDYRKFHTNATIVGTNGVVDDEGKPVDPSPASQTPPASTPPKP